MIDRYRDAGIAAVWTDEAKLNLWQGTELAVIKASEELGIFPAGVFSRISDALLNKPIDVAWWKERDAEVRHDLNAFLDERLRYIPIEYQPYFHKNITSYDTEETPFMKMLKASCEVIREAARDLKETLRSLALQHRFTIMNGRTHGQEAELQSFGKRCLTWFKTFRESYEGLGQAKEKLRYSKIAGAVGNYGSISPEVEKRALAILGFEPFYGATQIIPREIHLPLAGALLQMALSLEKIGLDIRLGARSGRPIYHEPFSKKQKGSSAMPHKKNTIFTENIQGMARLARGYYDAIRENIVTWEERSIEQSSVERVAWPDLFHVVAFSLKRMNSVLKGFVVYQDNMMKEIIESRGCYASSEVKELIKESGFLFGIDGESAYKIVQLAAFNVFEPSADMRRIRNSINSSLEEADALLSSYKEEPPPVSIKDVIMNGQLRFTDQLDIPPEKVNAWNAALHKIFSDGQIRQRWEEIFTAAYLLKNEGRLYQEILGL